MSEQGLNKRYISIKWQAFSLTSLVLAIIFGAFLVFISESTLKQFEIGRSHIYDQNRQQLDNLIEVAADRLVQLANTSILPLDMTRAIRSEDESFLGPKIDELAWSLQVDAGVEYVSVYNRYGRLITTSGEAANKDLVVDILNEEAPQWTVNCVSTCLVEGGTPVLDQGEVVGVVVLSEPLSNVMLRFRHISNIDTGLLTDSSVAQDPNRMIPSWNKNLVALTNPQNSQEIIDSASSQYSLQQLENGVHLVDVDNEVFELRALPIQDNQFVVISNVSQDIVNMERSKQESIRISIISLVIAECFLLILLWRPMTRLRKTASTLPLLAERRFNDVRDSLKSLSNQQLFNDETDILNVTAIKLSSELEDLQAQLEARADQLEARGRELEKERDFVNQLLDTVHAIILIQDEQGVIQLANRFAVKLSGYSQQELKGFRYASLLDQTSETESLSNRIRDVVDGNLSEYQHEAVLNTREGGRLHLAWRHAVLFNHETEQRLVLSVAVDISARVKAESEMAWLANHDTLSGLYNRHRFEEELKRSFAISRRRAHSFGVVFIDLDDFKLVNDTYGHQKGDELIQAVSRVLTANARESDFVARMGGDEFAILIRDFDPSELNALGQRMIDSLSAMTSVSKPDSLESLDCAASIGIAVKTDDTANMEMLLTKADEAMYQAKAQGKNTFVIHTL